MTSTKLDEPAIISHAIPFNALCNGVRESNIRSVCVTMRERERERELSRESKFELELQWSIL